MGLFCLCSSWHDAASPTLCWDACLELSKGKGQLGDCGGPRELLLVSGLVLLVPAAANLPLPQQGRRRGPARSHDMKKSRWRDQVIVR